MLLPDFLTHYYEEERGPFLNICELSDDELQELIAQEQGAATAFNRFSLGPDFWKLRRLADDLLVASYTQKFQRIPARRPIYAILGKFDRTLTMFRRGASIEIPLADLGEEDVTFIYPDHFFTVYNAHPELRPNWYFPEPFHGLLLTQSELPGAIAQFGLLRSIEAMLARDGWGGCYIEAHIWCECPNLSAATP